LRNEHNKITTIAQKIHNSFIKFLSDAFLFLHMKDKIVETKNRRLNHSSGVLLLFTPCIFVHGVYIVLGPDVPLKVLDALREWDTGQGHIIGVYCHNT